MNVSSSPRSTSIEPCRVALIGAGAAGQMRAQCLARISTARLVAVADQDLAKAEALAAMMPQARAFADPETIIEDPGVDGVIISTPPSAHEDAGLACLRAGKHVLCEKPLAISVEACEGLVDAAHENGVCLATGFTLRQTPAARLAKEIVDSGGIGDIDHMRAFHGHSGTEYFGPDWTLDRAVTGGGTLMDGGIHMIDLLRWFLGDLQMIGGVATENVWRKSGCEDNGFLLLRNAAGQTGQLHSSWTEWRGYRYQVEIYGNRGYVRFGYSPLWLVHGRGNLGTKMRIKRHFFPSYQVLERLKGWQWSSQQMLLRDTIDWLSAIATGSEAPASGRDGLEAVRLAQSVDRGKG